MTIQEILFELTDASGWEIDCMGQERYDELFKELEQARIEAAKQIKQLIESVIGEDEEADEDETPNSRNVRRRRNALREEQRNILEKL